MATWDRNWGCRVEINSTIRGWPVAVIQNEKIRVSILVGKGCDVIEFLYKPRDMDITPRTGRGLRTRDEVLGAPWSEYGSFLDNYEGGWQEIVPHGGGPGEHLGASFPQHGEAARLPWEVKIIQNNPDYVEILCSVRLSVMPFFIEKRFSIVGSDASLVLNSTITNDGAVDLPLMAGHHVAFGMPFIGPGSEIEMPEGTTYTAHPETVFDTGRRSNGASGFWPIMTSSSGEEIDMRVLPDKGTRSDLHYLKPPLGLYYINSNNRLIRAKVTWDLTSQPYLWFWQEFGAGETYPWWGMEYLVGLEPWSSAPGSGLEEAVKMGTAPIIKPMKSFSTSLKVSIEEQGEIK